MLALTLLSLASVVLAVLFPSAAAGTAEHATGSAVGSLRSAADWCHARRATVVAFAAQLVAAEKPDRPASASMPSEMNRTIERTIGTLLVAGIGVVEVLADIGLLILTASAMLDLETPSFADWLILGLMGAASLGALVFWGMVVLDLLGWGPQVYDVWPKSGWRRWAFAVLAGVMAAAVVAVLVCGAFYRDRLLVSTAPDAPANASVQLQHMQQLVLVGLAIVAAFTGAVACTAIPRAGRVTLAAPVSLVAAVLAVWELLLRALSGAVRLVGDTVSNFLKQLRDEMRAWRDRREAARPSRTTEAAAQPRRPQLMRSESPPGRRHRGQGVPRTW